MNELVVEKDGTLVMRLPGADLRQVVDTVFIMPAIRELIAYRQEAQKWLQKHGQHALGCTYREWDCSQPGCGESHITQCSCGLEGLLAKS